VLGLQISLQNSLPIKNIINIYVQLKIFTSNRLWETAEEKGYAKFGRLPLPLIKKK